MLNRRQRRRVKFPNHSSFLHAYLKIQYSAALDKISAAINPPIKLRTALGPLKLHETEYALYIKNTIQQRIRMIP